MHGKVTRLAIPIEGPSTTLDRDCQSALIPWPRELALRKVWLFGLVFVGVLRVVQLKRARTSAAA